MKRRYQNMATVMTLGASGASLLIGLGAAGPGRVILFGLSLYGMIALFRSDKLR